MVYAILRLFVLADYKLSGRTPCAADLADFADLAPAHFVLLLALVRVSGYSTVDQVSAHLSKY